MTSLCRSASSAATAAFTFFHWDQKHFYIFFASFWKYLWSFNDLSQLDHWRHVQNKGVPTQFLLHLLDTQLPSDSARVSIMRSSACLSELSSHAVPCHAEDLSPLPALAQVPEAMAALEPVRLLLEVQVASWSCLPRHLFLQTKVQVTPAHPEAACQLESATLFTNHERASAPELHVVSS